MDVAPAEPVNLLDLAPEESLARLQALGLSITGARRVMASRLVRRDKDLSAINDIPRGRRPAIEAATRLPALAVLERRVDPEDGFAKYLFGTPDGREVEAVRIPLLPGKDGIQRFTVCISTEAGCAMGCGFCATAKMGLVRRLETWEIVAQVLHVRDEAPGRVSGAVFMGMGEPLDNMERVLRAADVMCFPTGLAIEKKRMTISTVGLVPEIRKLTALRRKERLAVSLFSAVEATRRKWIPIARKYPLPMLREALVEHCEAGGRPLVAVTMIAGVTTTPEEGRALAAWVKGLPVTIDLIDVNDASGALVPPSEEERAAFVHELRAAERPIQRRYSGGRKIEAGCGMLAATRAGGLTALPMAGSLAHPRVGAGPVDAASYQS